jgi:hypothetical protein
MGMCRSIRSFSGRHEWVGNAFSLLAVVLVFATIGASLHYYQPLAGWIAQSPVLHAVGVVAVLALDVLLILGLLAVGSARPGEEDERCFGTFRGRRGGGSPLDAVRNWLLHMENVGKKHR